MPADTKREKMFPIQGVHGHRDHKGRMRQFPSTHIDWRLAELAYSEYVQQGGRGQSLKRVAERAGFGVCELAFFLLGALGYDVNPFQGTVKPPKESRPDWSRDLNPDVFKGD